ncbi:hypothetical protein TST_0909 [Thermosulfidibacter takaii ABI70S6]|uniref:DUF4350 domain-containing protein n=1 Tax=Thermosulfidibacter takaii (strain DSM 17441 / JCM 13301 / NBRC 103674 / ABI70S6) TaxID=1298851 RepID=A0A0S3QTQ2_THET7|nr:hypothetical protein [Thermosulfidibacter takaii]BAT71709.1 hypothetical protein TST_0909 [Thermosulfidibacter takaii ABI70S6]
MKKYLIIVALMLVALTPFDYGKLPKVRALVVYKENVQDLWNFLTKGGNYQVLDIRAGIAYLPTELQDLIRKWVNAGGGALAYMGADDEGDSAKIFLKDQEVEYASLNRWTPVVLKRPANLNHPLLKGVERVKLYLFRIPDIKNMQGKIPLLETVDGKTVALAMSYGKGRVVILPTGPLMPYFPLDQYDNERFFINIYQWLAYGKVP